jgi:hypothetical protein
MGAGIGRGDVKIDSLVIDARETSAPVAGDAEASVEGGYESVPIPGLERENASISELISRLAEPGIEGEECVDGRAFRHRRRVLGLFGGQSQAKIEFLGSVGSSSHFVSRGEG